MLLILDFDGVLVDSVVEHAVASYALISRIIPNGPAELPREFFERFRRNRCHVAHAGDLVSLARWALAVKEGDPDLTIDTAAQVFNASHEVAAEAERQFFAKRAEIVERDRGRWLVLNPPFPDVWEAVRTTQLDKVVLTTKNRIAVLDIAEHYGLPMLPDDVYAGDGRTTKSENIRRIQARFKERDALFVDDVLANLLEVKEAWQGPSTLRLALASWGYTSGAHMDEAKALGIEVLTRPAFVETICSAR